MCHPQAHITDEIIKMLKIIHIMLIISITIMIYLVIRRK